jgi:hypothetical protein
LFNVRTFANRNHDTTLEHIDDAIADIEAALTHLSEERKGGGGGRG